MAVSKGVAWNDLTGRGHTKLPLRVELRRTSDITGPGDWRDIMDALLGERGDTTADAVLAPAGRRTRTLAGVLAGTGTGGRRERIRQSARAGGVGKTAVQELQACADRIVPLRERFRADELLPEGGLVTSARAYDRAGPSTWPAGGPLARTPPPQPPSSASQPPSPATGGSPDSPHGTRPQA
jgi:hypothetical protein